MVKRYYPLLTSLLLGCQALHAAAPAVDTIPHSLSLPPVYPESVLFVHDFNYYNLINGKFVILDLAAESRQHLGAFQGAQLANFAESKRRSELYVAETVYARATHGQRTDLLTIYEKVNLNPIAEVILPGEKRALMAPQKAATQLTGDEKFLLVFNFTPAASVTVVDLDKRQVVNEVPIPGCSLNYASGARGFFALCANGTLVGFVLNDKGEATDEYVSERFNDLDDDVLAVHSTVIGGITYLASFNGHIQPIDTTRDKPKVLSSWSLVTAEETAMWRPASGQAISTDASGRLFVLMKRKPAKNAEKALTEVWVFDVSRHNRLKRFALKNVSSAIEVTRGANPWLAAVSEEGIDVYKANSGEFVRTIGGWISWTPILLYAGK